MNKTVTINISGIIFHIEEDAFDKLSKYLSAIKGYFKDTEGRDEIMADIEARIAEILKEKTSPLKQVVLMRDVDEVMEVMGKPEDFAGDGQQQEKKEEEKKEKQDSGTGAGTQSSSGKSRSRRVFRDPDNKIVAGVCSGIAAHFDIDPLWLRLALVAIVLLGGAGILVYIILWAVIPKANTTAEKLEMRGEEVNINTIKRNFEEEMEHLKKKMKDLETGAKEFGNSFKRGGERRDAAERLGDFLKDVFGGAFRLIGRIFAFFLIIICVGMIIGLVGSLFGLTVINNIALNHLSDFIFDGSGQSHLAMLGILLAAGIPLLMLLYSGVRALFGIRQRNRFISLTSLGLWLAGVCILLYVGYSVGNDFSNRSSTTSQVIITQPKCDTLFLRAIHSGTVNADDEDNWNIVSENGDKVMIRYPRLKIQQSEDDSFRLEVTAYARGFDNVQALNRAKRIRYNVVQKDSVLEFPTSFEIEKQDKWRVQEVHMTLFVPKNKMIFLSNSMRNILYNVDNLSDTWDRNMVNRRWLMTAEGLACVDCSGLDNSRHSHGRHAVPAPPESPTLPKK